MNVTPFFPSPHWILFALFLVGWPLSIILGILCALRKRYSPRWMWFAIHPFGGWVVFIVLSALPARIVCPNCGGYVAEYFRICPYCHTSLTKTADGDPH